MQWDVYIYLSFLLKWEQLPRHFLEMEINTNCKKYIFSEIFLYGPVAPFHDSKLCTRYN